MSILYNYTYGQRANRVAYPLELQILSVWPVWPARPELFVNSNNIRVIILSGLLLEGHGLISLFVTR